MGKKEEEMPKRISVVELVSKKPEGRYVLDEEAYIGMIDEYNMHREYILNRLSDVGKLEREMDSIFKPATSKYDYSEAMYGIFDRIRRHKSLEKECGYELYTIGSLFEKMKEKKKGMKPENFVAVMPRRKSLMGEFVKPGPERPYGRSFNCIEDIRGCWLLDWMTYETMLKQFIGHRRRVNEILERTLDLKCNDLGYFDDLDDEYGGMLWKLECSFPEMSEAERNATILLEEIIDIMNENGKRQHTNEDGGLVNLIPTSLYNGLRNGDYW